MGGRFGEMSTLMNYTFQSFNFRNRQGARPFYDLIANIAAEEFGHIELVAAAINTMLTGAAEEDRRLPTARSPGPRASATPQHFLAGGQGALPQDSHGKPWTGDYVFSSGDLVEDLTHNFFLETGARNGKLKVYEMVEHPAARALTGYLLVRGGVHQVAYARAVEKLTGADMTKLFPAPRIPTAKIPECKPHIEAACTACSTASRRATTRRSPRSSTARTPRPARTSVVEDGRRRASCPNDLPSQPDVFAPDHAPEEIAEIAQRCARPPACPTSRPASWPTTAAACSAAWRTS